MEKAANEAAPPLPPPAAAVADAGEQDPGDGTVQCTQHRFNNGGNGVCAFCLQEKLGKLVSSSFPPHPIIPSSSSSPSPSFRSDVNGVYAIPTTSSVQSSSSSSAGQRHKMMIPFLSAKKNKNRNRKSPSDIPAASFGRSKSTTSALRRGSHLGCHQVEDISPRSRRVGFWSSFFYHSSSLKQVDSSKTDGGTSGLAIADLTTGEEDDSLSQRKVSRSRSVGCGSRSFSGDIFERISNGLGDCTLRRAESQREGNGKAPRQEGRRPGADQKPEPMMKERVKCGGIFGGFMLTTSSSSSSSSSSYWVSDETGAGANGNGNCTRPGGVRNVRARGGSGSHGSWAWVFPSPIRAFSRPSKADEKTDRSKKNGTNAPNLNAIPSILSVSG